nr:unnamed protein product [Spirometra erinaceieuropaei]
MWQQSQVVQDFKDVTIVHLSVHHRGPSLLNIAGMIFARFLLSRINSRLTQGLFSECQCRFRRHRGTTDMTFAARQLQEE